MDQVGDLLNRHRFYNNIDGVGELSAGFMLLGFALLQWLQVHAPEGAIWHRMYVLILYVGGMCAAIHYGTKAIKKHMTYPRTGFVECRKSERWRAAAIAAPLGALVSAGVAVALWRHWDISAAVSLFGLAFAACYAWGIARAVRWKWVIVWAIALESFVIAFLPASVFGALAGDSWVTHPVRTKLVGAWLLSLMSYGAMLLISGSISLWLYLRHTQAPVQEEQ
ncbi:MAG: hypothetical protein ABSF98_25820 [Bryobacteraceae bacterium]|jgi:hypothetical protein